MNDSVQSFQNEIRKFTDAINCDESNDPLDLWFRFICFLEQNSGNDVENLFKKSLENCLSQFEKYENYKQDLRMVKLWIKYIDFLPNPLDLYQILYQRQIGTQCSAFYIGWAHYYNASNAFKQAESIYNLGLQLKAQPIEELEAAQKKFRYSVAQRMLYDDSSSKKRTISSLAEQRQQITSLSPQQQQQQSAAKKGRYEYENYQNNNKYQTEQQTSSGSNGNYNYQYSKTNQAVQEPAPVQNRQNYYENGSSNDAGYVISSSLNYVYDTAPNYAEEDHTNNPMPIQEVQKKKEPPFAVEDGIQLPPNFIVSAKNNTDQWHGPLCLEEPFDPNRKCFYPKHIVYPGNGSEYSLEEIRARKHFSRIEEETKRIEDLERKRLEELERQRAEAERQKQMIEAERQKQLMEHERQKMMEIERQKQMVEMARKRKEEEDERMKYQMYQQNYQNSYYQQHQHQQQQEYYMNNYQEYRNEYEYHHQEYGYYQHPQQNPHHQQQQSVIVSSKQYHDQQQYYQMPYQQTEPHYQMQQPQPQQMIPQAPEPQPQPQQFIHQPIQQYQEPTPIKMPENPVKIQEDPVESEYESEEFEEIEEEQESDDEDSQSSENYTQPQIQVENKVQNNSDDLEEQIEASTISFCSTATNGISTQKKITIKFRKEKSAPSSVYPSSENNSGSSSPATFGKPASKGKKSKPTKFISAYDNENTQFMPSNNNSCSERPTDDAELLLSFSSIQKGQKPFDGNESTTNSEFNRSFGNISFSTNANGEKTLISNNFSSTACSTPIRHSSLSRTPLTTPISSYKFLKKHESNMSSANDDSMISFTADQNSFFQAENDEELQKRRLDKALETIDNHFAKRDIDPFSSELCKAFLVKLNFPNRENTIDYRIVNQNLPKLGKNQVVPLGGFSYQIEKEVGRGSYGAVFRGIKTDDGSVVALKYQKPANSWELYICTEVKNRLKHSDILPGFMAISAALIAPNASVLISEFSQYGSLLDINNKIRIQTTKVMHESLVMHFSSQILNIVDYLHSISVIHADIKPDNFLIFIPPNEPENPSLRLIDFGCAIDMTLFNKGTEFRKIVQTDGFTCTEMMEGRPWTYQTDLFCVAATIHVMLFGEYMQIVKKFETWEIKQKFPRYLKKHVWSGIIEKLLNIKSSNELPNLQDMRRVINRDLMGMENELSKHIRTLLNIMKRR